LADKAMPLANRLRTVAEHAARQMAKALDGRQSPVLATGGGACNSFLMERLTALCKSRIVIPGDELVHYKEALVFAFLGLLRKRNEINTLSSVTGASRDSSGGSLFAGSGQ
jgi:anhydro-N-acetylmuramic acid kinase